MGIPLALFSTFASLAARPDLRVTAVLPAAALAAVALLALALFAGERGFLTWGPGTILGIAALLRLLFLVRPPELSDDVYRYLWDGLTTLGGANPFALAPAAVHPAGAALAWLRPLVNHPDLVTIYPPAAQLLFAGGAALGGTVFGLKALFAVLDLGACALLLRVLSDRGLPAWRAALYAWHPLPVFEIAGSGHVDGVGLAFFVLALALLGPGAGLRRTAGAGGALAAAVLTKLFPLVWAPGLVALAGRRRAAWLVAGAGVTAAALCAPFAPELANALPTLGTYARHWEFSGFAFRSLRALLGSGDAARVATAALFALSCLAAYAPLRRRQDDEAVFRALAAVTFAFLLLTPTLHPWYALPLAGLLPLAPGPGALVLSAAVFLAYRVLPGYALLGEWVESDLVAAAVFASGVAALALGAWARRWPAHASRAMTQRIAAPARALPARLRLIFERPPQRGR